MECNIRPNEGARKKDGYWQIWPKTHNGYHTLHRYVYAKHHGINLTSKDIIRHLCSNPSCVEITHLALGTSKDNFLDTIEEGNFNIQKLLPGQVNEIRRKYEESNDLTMTELAVEYGVSVACISDIISRINWRD